MDGVARWRVLGCSVAAMFVLGGVYAYGALLPAIMDAFGWDRATAAMPQSALLMVYALGMGVGGFLQDRLGARPVAVAGAVSFAAGLLLASRASSLAGLVASYGGLSGVGFGFVYVASVTATMKAFARRRGLAAGVVVGAFGLGTFLWAPLAAGYAQTLGWSGVLAGYGVLAALSVPALALGVRLPGAASRTTAETVAGVSPREAVGTSLFWIIFLAYALVTTVGLFLLAHLVGFGLARGLSPWGAALLLSLSAVGSGVGRILMGGLSDRIGRFPALIAAAMLETLALAGLAAGPPVAALFVLSLATGLAYGTWLALYGPVATDLFGLRHAGAIYGVLYLSYGLGALAGPTFGGRLADIQGYGRTFMAGALLCLLAGGLFLLAHRHAARGAGAASRSAAPGVPPPELSPG